MKEEDTENLRERSEEDRQEEAGNVGESPVASGEEPRENAETDYKAEYESMKDKYVRLYAEFENFRRRTAKENFELIASANAKLIAKLTDVLDTFALAFDPKHKTEKLEDFEKGIRLIYNKFEDILEDEGLEEVNPVGEEFNPNLHEALMQQPSDSVEENHIIEVLQKGYKVKSKILKHARVVVSTGKPDQT